MNFLSHDVVLPAHTPALVRVAAQIPDLWTLLPKRPLPLILLRHLRESDNPTAKLVGRGLDYHLHADAIFHRLPQFSDRTAQLALLLRETWPELRHPQLAAHVLVEMLLDRFLIRSFPAALGHFYDAFTDENIRLACHFAADNDEAREILVRILTGFSSSRFLADYLSNEGLVARFLGSLSRTPFALSSHHAAPQLVERIPRWDSMFEATSTQLLNDVRVALASREFG